MDVASLIDERFIARHDVKAWQNGDGYLRDATPIEPADLDKHLSGVRSLGHYLIDPETQTTKLFAFDIDLTKSGHLGDAKINPRDVFAGPPSDDKLTLLAQLKCMAYGLGSRTHKRTKGKVHIACAFSGNKGLHVYGLIPDGAPAAQARRLAASVLESFGYVRKRGDNFWGHPDEGEWPNLEIEVFPKQDTVDRDSYGNLMRLPLGVNAKSGKAGCFIRLDDEATKMHKLDPIDVLERGVLPWT